MWHTKFYKVRTLLFSLLILTLFTPLGNPLLQPQCWLLDYQFFLLESFSLCATYSVDLSPIQLFLFLPSSVPLPYLFKTNLQPYSAIYLNTLFFSVTFLIQCKVFVFNFVYSMYNMYDFDERNFKSPQCTLLPIAFGTQEEIRKYFLSE